MTRIQAGEGARFPHRRNPTGSLRERRSGMENGVCQEESNKSRNVAQRQKAATNRGNSTSYFS
jgi:hypothetical protein